MYQDDNNIEITDGGKVYAYNHERHKSLHVGTIAGVTYEKGNASVLQKPVPSFSLTTGEYHAVTDAGAEYLRLIPRDKTATYTISLDRFYELAEPYNNTWYGAQYRVPLSKFQKINATKKRTKRLDSPAKVTEGGDVIEQRRERQMSLFG